MTIMTRVGGVLGLSPTQLGPPTNPVIKHGQVSFLRAGKQLLNN